MRERERGRERERERGREREREREGSVCAKRMRRVFVCVYTHSVCGACEFVYLDLDSYLEPITL